MITLKICRVLINLELFWANSRKLVMMFVCIEIACSITISILSYLLKWFVIILSDLAWWYFCIISIIFASATRSSTEGEDLYICIAFSLSFRLWEFIRSMEVSRSGGIFFLYFLKMFFWFFHPLILKLYPVIYHAKVENLYFSRIYFY